MHGYPFFETSQLPGLLILLISNSRLSLSRRNFSFVENSYSGNGDEVDPLYKYRTKFHPQNTFTTEAWMSIPRFGSYMHELDEVRFRCAVL